MFAGNHINPIADARLSAGISASSLANRISLSKQYISRAEQGTYNSLNEDLVNYAASRLVVSTTEVMKRYREFQARTRRKTARSQEFDLLARAGSLHPGHVLFTKWREGYWSSVIAFSNAWCLHPEMIRAYEEGLRSTMPLQLRELLIEFQLLDPNWSDDLLGDQQVNEALRIAAQRHSELQSGERGPR